MSEPNSFKSNLTSEIFIYLFNKAFIEYFLYLTFRDVMKKKKKIYVVLNMISDVK